MVWSERPETSAEPSGCKVLWFLEWKTLENKCSHLSLQIHKKVSLGPQEQLLLTDAAVKRTSLSLPACWRTPRTDRVEAGAWPCFSLHPQMRFSGCVLYSYRQRF